MLRGKNTNFYNLSHKKLKRTRKNCRLFIVVKNLIGYKDKFDFHH